MTLYDLTHNVYKSLFQVLEQRTEILALIIVHAIYIITMHHTL